MKSLFLQMHLVHWLGGFRYVNASAPAKKFGSTDQMAGWSGFRPER